MLSVIFILITEVPESLSRRPMRQHRFSICRIERVDEVLEFGLKSQTLQRPCILLLHNTSSWTSLASFGSDSSDGNHLSTLNREYITAMDAAYARKGQSFPSICGGQLRSRSFRDSYSSTSTAISIGRIQRTRKQREWWCPLVLKDSVFPKTSDYKMTTAHEKIAYKKSRRDVLFFWGADPTRVFFNSNVRSRKLSVSACVQ